MKKIILILIESFNIIVESFRYLFKEIAVFIRDILKGLARKFSFKKKSNLEEILRNTEKRNLKSLHESIDKHEILFSKEIKNGVQGLDKKNLSREGRNNIKKKRLNSKLAIIFFLLLSLIFTYLMWDLPDYKVLKDYQPPLITRVYSADGTLLSEFAVEKRLFVPLERIPKVVVDAFISAEDKNFYRHFGFDFFGLVRAFYNNVLYAIGLSDNIEGASTITQQVVKNFLLTNDRTIKRKIREAILTVQVELAYSKDHILELYFNEIYLGRGSYGVSVASLNYFNKPVTDLTLEEAAFLAVLPKAPARYDPKLNYEVAKERRDWVISRMLAGDKIREAQAKQAISKPIIVFDRSQEREIFSSYASEEIRKDIVKRFGYEQIYGGGLIIKTSINQNLQKYAYEVLRKGIVAFDIKKGYRGAVDSLMQPKEFLLKSDRNSSNPNWLKLLSDNPSAKKYKVSVAPWRVAIVIDIDISTIQFGLLDGKIFQMGLNDNFWAYKSGSGELQLTNFNSILKYGDIILVENSEGFWKLRQIPEVDGALIAMNPQTGEILAMQGGFSFLLSEFNRSTQSLRQPGSAFKPFVYLSAIQKGINNNDLVLDAPLVVDSSEESWRPRNSYDTYGGFVTLRNALEHSRNLATLRIANNVGLDRISKLAIKLGLYDKPLENLSEILGSREVTLLNLVNAYSSLVNGGKKVTPSLLRQVQANNGTVVFKNDTRFCKACAAVEWNNQSAPELEDLREQLFDPSDAYMVVSLLQGVVERGTGRRAKFAGYNIAGKTGTTNEVKDAWFIGFTPDLVVGIYFGSDTPKSLGNTEGATSIAVPVFASFMRQALSDMDAMPFRTPSGIDMRWVNYKNGAVGDPGKDGVILEVFKKNSSDKQKIIADNGRLEEVTPEEAIISSDNEDGIY